MNMTLHRQLHKFGGSSLTSYESYQKILNTTLKKSQSGDIIVVSASGNTTNKLIELINLSAKYNKPCKKIIEEISCYQKNLIKQLLNLNLSKILINNLEKDLNKLTNLLKNKINDQIYAEILGYGEVWSARLMSSFLNQKNIPACDIDSRDFLRVEKSVQPKINEKISQPLLKKIIHKNKEKILVITGFLCRDTLGNSMLLGRNGSDYSATQIGYLANVACVTIWSDVSGVYSADPKKVKNAFLIPFLTVDEANELARLAAPVLHTRTLQPITNSNITLKLKCSFNPNKGSTVINKFLDYSNGAKIITNHENICLLEFFIIQHDKFIKIYQNIIFILKKLQIKPLSFYIDHEKKILKCCYTDEVINNVLDIIKKVNLANIILRKKNGFSLIGIVGKNINKQKNIIDKFFNHIKIMPIEFICENNNISITAIVHGTIDKEKIIDMHNDLFYMKKKIGLVLFGKGNIGLSWLQLFNDQRLNIFKKNNRYEVILAGVINSSNQILKYEGINCQDVLNNFKNISDKKNQKKIFLWMEYHPFNELVIIDATASTMIAKQYLHFAESKFHLISANKIAPGTFDIEVYKKIKNTFRKNNCYWFFNATVGAGLPINYTIKDLCNTGDNIFVIKGIFSGTLSWLFIKFDGSLPFTKLVKKAWQNGLTEPDPRIDLSGEDVTRKLVILAREIGYDININQVKVESLITKLNIKISLDDFFKKDNELNYFMIKKLNKAKSKNYVLRYVAELDIINNIARIGLKYLPHDHYLSNIKPCDNVFAIKSKWYMKNLLIIRGPGAGKNVTAGAIQSDINKLINLLENKENK